MLQARVKERSAPRALRIDHAPSGDAPCAERVNSRWRQVSCVYLCGADIAATARRNARIASRRARGTFPGRSHGGEGAVTPTSDDPGTGPLVAKIARSALGGVADVAMYYDAAEGERTPILTCQGVPAEGFFTCSTVSLHMTTNLLEDTDIRVELMMCGESGALELRNVLASAAFNVIKDGWLAAPGVVFPGLVREYFPDTTTPHVMWTEPVNCPDLGSVAVQELGAVHWLLAVPISDAEFSLLKESGYFALEEVLGSAGAEYHDIHRASVV